jgi:hypothetical protein
MLRTELGMVLDDGGDSVDGVDESGDVLEVRESARGQDFVGWIPYVEDGRGRGQVQVPNAQLVACIEIASI